MKERVFWSFLALSTLAAAIFGYYRFQQIRPDLFDQDPAAEQAAEQQRLERIDAYQERARAQAWGRVQPRPPEPQALGPGQRCVDGVVFEVRASEEGSVIARVERDGQPIPCHDD